MGSLFILKMYGMAAYFVRQKELQKLDFKRSSVLERGGCKSTKYAHAITGVAILKRPKQEWSRRRRRKKKKEFVIHFLS